MKTSKEVRTSDLFLVAYVHAKILILELFVVPRNEYDSSVYQSHHVCIAD